MPLSFQPLARVASPGNNEGRSCPRPGQGSHTAHFYASDDGLIAEIGHKIASALGAGGAAVVIAAPSHRHGLAEYLAAGGIDLARAGHRGRWLALDADKTLDEFTDDGHPDPERFRALIGGILDRLAPSVATGAPIVVYGEMVAVLWQNGHSEVSLRLEELWNHLARTRTFHLFCGWPLALFSDGPDAVAVDGICSLHTHVTPSLGYEHLSPEERRRGAFLWQLKAQNVLEHVSRISRQTLGFYRKGRPADSVSIPHAIDEMLTMFSSRLDADAISVIRRIPPGLSVHWPEGECKQILSSLIANAIDASFPGATIYLAARPARHPRTGIRGVRFTAGDQGLGIPASLRARIFTPFSAGSRDINIGLGLWNVRDLLHHRGGYIHCRSRTTTPTGTLISVFLPAEPLAAAA
jgi:hypothetical protein